MYSNDGIALIGFSLCSAAAVAAKSGDSQL